MKTEPYKSIRGWMAEVGHQIYQDDDTRYYKCQCGYAGRDGEGFINPFICLDCPDGAYLVTVHYDRFEAHESEVHDRHDDSNYAWQRETRSY